MKTHNLPHQQALEQFAREIGPVLLRSKRRVTRERVESQLRSILPKEEVDAMLDE